MITLSGEYIDRKEFNNKLSELKTEIKNERQGLHKDIQEMKEVLNNGVKRRAEENKKELKSVDKKLSSIESKIDKAQGGLSTLGTIGTVLISSVTSVGAFVGILKALGILSHWT